MVGGHARDNQDLPSDPRTAAAHSTARHQLDDCAAVGIVLDPDHLEEVTVWLTDVLRGYAEADIDIRGYDVCCGRDQRRRCILAGQPTHPAVPNTRPLRLCPVGRSYWRFGPSHWLIDLTSPSALSVTTRFFEAAVPGARFRGPQRRNWIVRDSTNLTSCPSGRTSG